MQHHSGSQDRVTKLTNLSSLLPEKSEVFPPDETKPGLKSLDILQ